MKTLIAPWRLRALRSAHSPPKVPSAVTVDRKSEQKIETGPEYFTGRAQIAGLFERPEPSRLTGAIVTFDPGARTAWHTHPAGQTLVVTRGLGLVQHWGDPARRFAKAMWCGFRRGSSIGTVDRPLRK